MINLDELIAGASSIGICGHIKPDGDAFGSCMGLYLFLRTYYPGIRAAVYLEDSYSETFKFVSCSEEIVHDYPEEEPYDVFIVLDCSDTLRIGRSIDYFNAAKKTVVIDHHVSNPGFGDYDEIQPDASSTSELVALLIGKERITREIAEPLYMGIVHDTGVFQYSCTSSRTMTVGGWLMDTGIDNAAICADTYFKKTYHQNQVLGRALTESIMMLDGRVIYSVIRIREMKFYEIGPKDLEGIVSQLRVTEGVETALFLYETGIHEYKVSMRSSGKVDVAKIAVYFKGGGHKMAAGCNMNGDVHDVVNNIVAKVAEQLDALENAET